MLSDSTLKSEITKIIPLEKVEESIEEYKKNMTAGKYLVCPSMKLDNEEEKK
jgi:hypothetical protein